MVARKDFSNQSLQNTNFSGVNLTGALLRHSDLRGANFNVAHIQEADFAFAKMDNVSLGQLELIEAIAYASDGLTLATLDVSGQVKIWNLATQREVFYLGKPEYFTSLSFLPNSNRLILGNTKGELSVVDINLKRIHRKLKSEDHSTASSIAIHPNGERIACSKESSKIEIWDFGRTLDTPVSINLDTFSPAIAFVDGGNKIVACTESGDLLFLDGDSGAIQRELKAHDGFIRQLVSSPDGTQLVSFGWDDAVLLWNTATGELIHEWRNLEFEVRAVSLIGVSTGLLLVALGPNSIIYWSAATNSESAIELGESTAKTFAFAPDSNSFVIAAEAPSPIHELNFYEFPSGKRKTSLKQQLNCLRTNIFEVTGLLPHQRRLLLESGAVEIDPVLLEGTGESISHFVHRQRLEEIAQFIADRRRRPYSPLVLFVGPGTFMSSEAADLFSLIDGLPQRTESPGRDPKIVNSQFDHFYNLVLAGPSSRRRSLRAQLNALRSLQGSLRNQCEALISLINEGEFSIIIDLDVFSPLNSETFGIDRHASSSDRMDSSLIHTLGGELGLFNKPKLSYFKLFDDLLDSGDRSVNTRRRLDYLIDQLLDEILSRQSLDAISILWTGFYPRRGLRRLPKKYRSVENRIFWVAAEELCTLPELKELHPTWLHYPIGHFADVFADLYRIIGYSPPEEPDAYINAYQLETLAKSTEVDKRIRAAESIVSSSIDKRNQSQIKRVLSVMSALSEDESSEVRRAVLSNILLSFFDIPFPVSSIIRKYAKDPDDFLQGEVARWILTNYEKVRKDFEDLLFEIAKSRSAYVRRCIIDTIRSRFEQLPALIRNLASDLVGTGLSVAIKSGGGMLFETATPLVLDITNHNSNSMPQVEVEIVGSGDFSIEGKTIVTLKNLEPESPQEVAFTIRPRVFLEFSVTIKINGEIKEPALRIVAIKDNPYVYGNPIDRPAAFFGRQRELEDIFQAVTKPNKQDILLVGERRTGKTSLLYQLLRRFQAPYIPVYVVINEAGATVIGVIRLIVRKIISSLIEREVLTTNPWNEYRCNEPSLTDNLKKVFDAARIQMSDLKIVLLMDEGDHLLNVDDQLQNILRAGLQSQEVGPDLRAVVAGTSSLSSYVSSKSSPFFNHFRFVTLTPLNKVETELLITKPAGILGYLYKPEAVIEISQASGGQPYYCQRICYEAFDIASNVRTNVITKEIAWQAIQYVIESPSDDAFKAFKTYYWDTATDDERHQMLGLLGTGKYRASPRLISNRLIDWQIVVRKEKSVEFSALLFEKWVQRLANTS
jgi:WD40 repeat protein/GTPase SAR1 family protein